MCNVRWGNIISLHKMRKKWFQVDKKIQNRLSRVKSLNKHKCR